MMGANLFEKLSLSEKTAIMAVLSRDRHLRETEEERVTKLRIDLARERREGALIPGRDATPKKRVCARCKGEVSFIGVERCPACKHVVCKKCRVYKLAAVSNSPLVSERDPKATEGDTNVTIAEKEQGLTAVVRSASSASYPSDLNPFEPNHKRENNANNGYGNPFEENQARENDSANGYGNPFNNRTLNSEDEEEHLPTIECEVIDDVPLKYDENLGKSLVGGDIGNIPLVSSVSVPNGDCHEVYTHDSGFRRFSDITYMRKKRRDFREKAMFNYKNNGSNFSNFNVGNHGLLTSTPRRDYSQLPTINVSDDQYAFSDSSAYMTANVSSPSHKAELGGLSKKSNSTGYLTALGDFNEKEAIDFLLQIGTTPNIKSEKSPTKNIVQDIDVIKKTLQNHKSVVRDETIYLSESNSTLHNKEEYRHTTPMFEDTLQDSSILKNNETETDTIENKPNLRVDKQTKFSSIMSSTFSVFENMAKDLKIASNKITNEAPQKKAFFGAFTTSTPKPKTVDVVSKFKDLFTLNTPLPERPLNKPDSTKKYGSAAKLFQMASNRSVPKEDEMLKQDISLYTLNIPVNITPVKRAMSIETQEMAIRDESDRGGYLNPRLHHSNPTSPYRRKDLMYSTSTDDVTGFISEFSGATDEDLHRPKESSSSNAPSTSSSEEYFYYHASRRRNRYAKSINNEKQLNVHSRKDSGYSTHENYLKAKRRSKYMRATRLSRRARERERSLRRLGKRSIKERLYNEAKRRHSSSGDLSESEDGKFLQRVRSTTLPSYSDPPILLDAKSTATVTPNVQSDSNIIDLDRSESKKDKSVNVPDLSQHTSLNRPRKVLNAKILFEKLKRKVNPTSRDRNREWLCKVCEKTIDVKKKSGDWFYVNTRPEVLHFKEHLITSKRKLSGDIPAVPLRIIERLTLQPSPLAVDSVPVASKIAKELSSSSLAPPAISRARSSTLPCEFDCIDARFSGRDRSLAGRNSVDMSQMEAHLQRQRMRMGRKSIAEVLHGTLLFHVPDPHTGGSAPQFVKKQTSVTEIVPACIKDGPKDTVIIRGHPVSLVCALGGTPPLKSVWRKGKNEIKSSSQCSIDVTNTSAALTIRSGEKDDSGCYTLQVKNSAGVDQFSVNVSIVDVPDPPGKPYASDISGTSLVLSWYGTGYDGGSTITSYQVEIAEITSASSVSRKWSRVASTKSTSCTVKDLKPNSKYTFRICAENKYGVSRPGEESDDVINTVTEVVESSEDEDEHFEAHGIVVVKANENFSHKYETKERLGQGRFGKVHRVVHRETGKQYAAKIMRALKAKDKEAVQQEIDVMNSLRHPRLVQLIDAYSHGREITMVMDLVSGGELFERVIDEDFELTEAACIKYMTQICEGLKYMHDTLILHLDLKPENIMCINKTGTQVKIIDFGLARKYNPKEVIRVMFGTPEFVAPEVINYDAIGPQTDMWSVGVICYILLSGLSPFMGDNDSETLSNITAAEWDFEDEAFDDISYEAKDFIRKLLVKRLNQRYTVDKALEHKWLKKDINKMQKSKLNTKNLKRFLARRKWQKTGNAVRALGRLASLANLGSQNSNANKISNGQPRESGFLAALKAQLLRENEEEQDFHENCKPMFDTLFDDVEVIEGSAAKFECTIIGTPDPEIMWYKDGEPIKESRHFRISYTEDDVCTLLITDTTEADEAEYSCKAVNCEGETEHRAELIVITPGM